MARRWFTYLRSRAEETPALHELREADRRFGRKGLEPSLVSYEVFDDGLYVADHVLGPGRLRIGDSETRGGPAEAAMDVEDPRAVEGGVFAAMAAILGRAGEAPARRSRRICSTARWGRSTCGRR